MKRFLAVLMGMVLGLMASTALAQSVPTPAPYSVLGSYLSVPAATSSARVALTASTVSFGALTIKNDGAVAGCFSLGSSTVVATTTPADQYSACLSSGDTITMWVGFNTYIAAITATSSTTFKVFQASGPVNFSSNSAASGATPIGAAGGDLSGTYPNPTVASIGGKAVSLAGALTTSGAFATTLTATATTALTLPTTGTLATLAGAETLSNKTITGPLPVTSATTSTIGVQSILAASQTPADWPGFRINGADNSTNCSALDWVFTSISGGTGPALCGYRINSTSAGMIFRVTSNDTQVEAMRIINAGTSGVAGKVQITSPAVVGHSALSLLGGAPTGGTGTTTLPQMIFEPTGTTAVTTWDTSGTLLGINGAATGTFIDAHAAGGTSVFKLSSAGLLSLPAITTDAGHTTSSMCQDTTTHAMYFGSGTIGVCLGTSSARYKTGIHDITVDHDAFMRLRPRAFFYKKNYGDGGMREQGGLIAEEVVSVMPSLVIRDAAGKPSSIDYGALIPILLVETQRQARQITWLCCLVGGLSAFSAFLFFRR